MSVHYCSHLVGSGSSGYAIAHNTSLSVSEMIGRKPVYVISMFFYFIFTLPSALAHNIGTMLVCRLVSNNCTQEVPQTLSFHSQIAGTASSAPMTNVGGTIADIWDAHERGTPMAVFSLTILSVANPLQLETSNIMAFTAWDHASDH